MSLASGSQPGTPIKQAKVGSSAKSLSPLASDLKKVLQEQHRRLWLKHQQDIGLMDDIRVYMKSRQSIERDYSVALAKLAKQHSASIEKKFFLLEPNPSLPANGCEQSVNVNANVSAPNSNVKRATETKSSFRRRASDVHDDDNNNKQQQEQRTSNTTANSEPVPSTLYKVWNEHLNRMKSSSQYRQTQYDQLMMVVERLRGLKQHKLSIGKRYLDNYMRKVHEDILCGIVEVEKARKLYYEDESQAKQAREREERIRKKKFGILAKFTDLQTKKEKTMAQREANDIQSTQARNDYIMALAAGNAHLEQYCQHDLPDFMLSIDDEALDHCKIFMATLNECDINASIDALNNAQYWSKMIKASGVSITNSIFLNSQQSVCLQQQLSLPFEACNNDPISSISLEFNADYALRHDVEKWSPWFKKECRTLFQLVEQLEECHRAIADGRSTIEIEGQTIDDIESKMIDIRQQIRRSQAAMLKAQARLRVLHEGGMQIIDWNAIEDEARATLARIQEIVGVRRRSSPSDSALDSSLDVTGAGAAGAAGARADGATCSEQQQRNNAATDERNAIVRPDSGHSQANHTTSMGNRSPDPAGYLPTNTSNSNTSERSSFYRRHNAAATTQRGAADSNESGNVQSERASSLNWPESRTTTHESISRSQSKNVTTAAPAWSYDVNAMWSDDDNDHDHDKQRLDADHNNANDNNQGANQTSGLLQAHEDAATKQQLGTQQHQQQVNSSSVTIQSSSPLSAIMDGMHGTSTSPYQHSMITEAYKSDYECDYNRNVFPASGHETRAGTANTQLSNQLHSPNEWSTNAREVDNDRQRLMDAIDANSRNSNSNAPTHAHQLIGHKVVTLYAFDGANDGDLSFNENEMLFVLEAEDANWVKARHEQSGREGYVPASYVQIVDDESVAVQHQDARRLTSATSNDNESNTSSRNKAGGGGGAAANATNSYYQSESDAGAWDTQDLQEYGPMYCRALYDYTPELDDEPDESDGLPHLAIKAGQVFKILDQSTDDGWWLVERDTEGEKGHVQSVLLEEIGGDDDDEDDDDNDNDGVDDRDDGDQDNEHLDADEDDPDTIEGPTAPPPSIPAPVLVSASMTATAEAHKQTDKGMHEQSATNGTCRWQTQEGSSDETTAATQSQAVQAQAQALGLAPTSFIIIQPTPEIESRSIGSDEQAKEGEREGEISSPQQEAPASTANHNAVDDEHPAKPKQTTAYSVINESFVLEGPKRRPHTHAANDASAHHETPTIIEDVDAEEEVDTPSTNRVCQASDGQQSAPVSDLPLPPPPPSVVIDSFEDDAEPGDNDDNELDVDNLPEPNFDDDSAASTTASQQQQYVAKKASPSQDQAGTTLASSNKSELRKLLEYRAGLLSEQITSEAIQAAATVVAEMPDEAEYCR